MSILKQLIQQLVHISPHKIVTRVAQHLHIKDTKKVICIATLDHCNQAKSNMGKENIILNICCSWYLLGKGYWWKIEILLEDDLRLMLALQWWYMVK